jgi:hypothetical protein
MTDWRNIKLSDEEMERYDERIKERIRRGVSDKHMVKCWEIELLWIEYDSRGRYDKEFGFNDLFHSLEELVRRQSEFAEMEYTEKRISRHDFESAFWEEAWKVAEKYDGTGRQFLYEKIKQRVKKRSLDVVRNMMNTKQAKFEHAALHLDEERFKFTPSEMDVEKGVTDKLLLQDIFAILNDEERRLLMIIAENPDVSDREIARLMGYKYNNNVARTLEKIRKKCELAGLNPFEKRADENEINNNREAI